MGNHEIEIETKSEMDETKNIEIAIDMKGQTNVTQLTHSTQSTQSSKFSTTKTENDTTGNTGNTDTFDLEIVYEQNQEFYEKMKLKKKSNIQ